MIHYGICEKCRLEVTSSSGPPAYPVTGWEVLRADGGANQIKDRERIPGRVRHAHCLPRPGEDDRQEAMELNDGRATTGQRVGYDGRFGAPGFS